MSIVRATYDERNPGSGECRVSQQGSHDSQPFGQATSLHGLFAHRADSMPDSTALVYGDRSLSYRELQTRAARLARRLIALDVRAGEPIGICIDRGPEMVVATLAILMVGCAYLPVDARYPSHRRNSMLADAQCRLLITSAALKPQFAHCSAKLVDVEIASSDVASCDPAACAADQRDLPRVDPDQVAYVIYTSGSTGQPKGVMITHRGACNTILDVNQRFQIGAGNAVLALSSSCFDLSVYDIFGMLAAGGTIVIPEPHQLHAPAAWVELIERHQITVWNSVPASMEMLMTYAASREKLRLDSLRGVLLSGDWISTSLPDRIRVCAPGAAIVGLGGTTETSIWSVFYPIDRVDCRWKSIPYGKPLANQTVYVLDDQLHECPAGVAGEIYIGGAGVALGYLNRPQLTADQFIADPFSARSGDRLYRTGDSGSYLPDGNIELLGRIDHQVKIHGYRVELREIELILARHPRVADAVVAARQGPGGGKYLAAYVVTLAGDDASDEQLTEFCAHHLPTYMIPARFVRLPRLPLGVNGKVDRGALPEPEFSTIAESRLYCAPQTPTERQLAELWSEILDIQPIGRNADFLQLGGDSLQAVELLVRIEQSFGLRLDLSSILGTAPRLMQLAERIDAGGSGDYAAPRDAWELRLFQIWERYFDIRPLSICDSFFDLGGDAELATTVMAEVNAQFGQNLSDETLYDRPTVEQLAELLRGTSHVGKSSSLIVVQASGTYPPLVCVPGIFGTTWEFRRLSKHLGSDFPLYALQPVGLDGVTPPHETIAEIAGHYVEQLRAVQPTGPYHIAGHSLGGTVAFEMARLLEANGETVATLILMDSPTRGRSRWYRMIQRVINSITNNYSGRLTLSASRVAKPLSAGVMAVAEGLADDFGAEGAAPSAAGLRLLRTHRQALDKYRPQRRPGHVTIFLPQIISRFRRVFDNNTAGWIDLCDKGGDVYVVPGDHSGMFSSGCVETLAETLRSCLVTTMKKSSVGTPRPASAG